jgi:hypothetical protein
MLTCPLPRRACDLLHDRDGALADERDRHRMGAHAVARDAAGGVGGAHGRPASVVDLPPLNKSRRRKRPRARRPTNE